MDAILIVLLATIGMFLLIALHVPIGVAMAVAGLAGFAFLSGWGPAVALLASGPVSVLSNMDLAVIPLFLLMGSFAGVSGLSADIYRLAYALIGHRPGGLALATVAGCAGFAAICGSSIATAATMGRVALPEMLKRGYSPQLATGTIAAGGTLGILIPPSHIMVIYAFLTEQFVITLFVAALVPGLIGVIVHLLAVQAVVWWNPKAGPAGSRTTWGERLVVLKECWGVIALILCVVVSIYGGIFTVNEAAALGAGLAFAFTVARGKLDWSTLWQVTRETATNTGMLYLIIAGASIFSSFMAVSKMPEALVTQISAFEPGKMGEFLSILKDHIARTRAREPGCVQFDLLVPHDEKDCIHLYEVYADEAAFRFHNASEQLVKCKAATNSLLHERAITWCTIEE